MKVKVTQEIINKGKKRVYESEMPPMFNCPIAIAAKIQDENVMCVTTVYIVSKIQFNKRAKLPKIATEFIGSFDSGIDVSPIEFECEWES